MTLSYALGDVPRRPASKLNPIDWLIRRPPHVFVSVFLTLVLAASAAKGSTPNFIIIFTTYYISK